MSRTPICPYDGVQDLPFMLPPVGAELEAGSRLWSPYSRGPTSPWLCLRRLKVLITAARSFPDHRVLRFRDDGQTDWAILFCYLPCGRISSSQRFTIERLVADGYAILLVCAAPRAEDCSEFVDIGVAGIIWKELRGYDFSGFTAGLGMLAGLGRSINVLVMNDSVLGPFYPVRALLKSSPWVLTGLVASNSVEQHVQSFAFSIHDFNMLRWAAMRSIFFRRLSFNAQGPVSFLQETRMASVLASSFSVGAVVAPLSDQPADYLVLGNPLGLVQSGFPFLKASIFTKFAASFDVPFYERALRELGHPAL